MHRRNEKTPQIKRLNVRKESERREPCLQYRLPARFSPFCGTAEIHKASAPPGSEGEESGCGSAVPSSGIRGEIWINTAEFIQKNSLIFWDMENSERLKSVSQICYSI